MEKQWWKERFIDRRSWILDHLQELTMNSEEALTILLIDFMNEHDMNISHGVLAEKLKKDLEDKGIFADTLS